MTIVQIAIETLRTWGRQQSGELLQRLGVSRPSLMRAISGLDGQVVLSGRARRTAYAARRLIRGNPYPLILYRIDETGRALEVGLLEPIYPKGCALSFTETCHWPLNEEMTDGWFRGVPYLLGDMRPQGFLGRNFAHHFATILQVDQDVKRWGEDDVLYALSVLGWDQAGNYILGEHALRGFLDAQQKGRYLLSDEMVDTEYPARALQALDFGLADSSAAGEFPKFTACRLLNGRPTHVIVKFAGADGSPQEQRWSDLLVCEHLALTTIADTLQLSAAQSRVYQLGGRTYFEVDRFDRHGEFGRSGVCTWYELNSALFGLTGPWSEGAEALLKKDYISAETASQIKLLEHFGRLIANTDMHDGNLAFLPGLTLTPAYDMLPMLYAPQRGVELVQRKFTPVIPLPRERSTWVRAAQAALVFWHRAQQDERITHPFRAICKANADHIERLLVTQRD
ncbi:type II toxin-antitoxin system HipA family toxin YjjJ [Glaciimonas immobilis]|uniref:HipA-like C-terminal domain-containing protein n=1 Tax=Glaciimonas immobilis TaxID=728004 RepID=A0A840RSU1_9BURK|nr:type II toxin-antitoxin system HipA family toxin YjjJ [Glaciimonas immobilis]KAF3996929.1 type II toxin-antitoxin system HipA family toxin YjjJ [Glaciimonas immobilis]MBB5199754.1 hypothetical protein [Glaciimonas immobilis]